MASVAASTIPAMAASAPASAVPTVAAPASAAGPALLPTRGGLLHLLMYVIALIGVE